MTAGKDMVGQCQPRSAVARRASTGSSALIAAALAGLSVNNPAMAQSGSVTVTVTLTVTATATIDTAKVQAATRTAIQGLMGERARLLTSTGPDTARTQSRLNGGSLTGGSGEPAAGLTDDDKPATNAKTSRQRGMGFDAASGTGSSADSTGAGAGFGNSGSFGSGAPGILDSDASAGPLSRFNRQTGRGNTLPSGRDDSRDFAQQFGFGRDYAPDQSASRGAMPFRFSGNAEDGTGRFAFAASLSQLRAAAEAKEREKLAAKGAAGVGAASDGETPQSAMSALGLSPTTPVARTPTKQAAVDVWVEGSSAYFTNDRIDGKRRGHASVVYAGTDVILMPGLLVGIMGQADWMADSNSGSTSTTGSQARDGRGWMAGPYLAARLTPNLYFDTRAAWGRSTNHVDPLGFYVDTFTASRALAAAKLTGDWTWGQLRVRPSAEVIWFRETSDAYTNAIGIAIDKQAFNLGRLTFGPEFGYRFALGDAGLLEPFVGFKGVWDFARTTETTAAGEPVGGDSVHGRVEAGATYRAPSGISVRASGQYDGVGTSGFHSVQGKAQLVVPLQ